MISAPANPLGMTPRGSALPADVAAPTTGEVLQAAFGLENSVVNFFRSVNETAPLRDPSTGQIPDDPDPDMWIDTTNFRGSKYETQYMDAFTGVNSVAQARLVMSRIDREEQYRATLARGGTTGFMANLAAGFLSPTSLIPIAGWYGAVARAGVGSRALAGASVAALSGAGAVALDEIVLQGAQQLRTPLESALNVAGGAVIAGALGAAAGALSRGTVSNLGRAVTTFPATRAEEATAFEATIAAGGSPASAGAAAVADARGTGELAPAGGVEKVLNWTDPLIRTQTSESTVTRNIVRDLAETPLNLAENSRGIATSLGGAVETIAKTARGPMDLALRSLDEQYRAYAGGRFAAVKGMVGLSGNRLGYTQFKEAVTDALLAGDVHAIAEVQNAAKSIRQVFDKLRDEAIAANVPGFKEAVDAAQRAGIDAGYIYRIYDTGAIARNRTKFVDILTQHFISKQEGANRAIGALERTASDRMFEADLSRQRMLTEVQSAADRRKRLRDGRRAVADTERAARRNLSAAERAREAEAAKAQRAAEREQSAVYRALLRDLKRGRPAERATDLMTYLRQIGGVRVANLDALGRVKSSATRGAELKAVIDGARNARIISRDGLDLDDALTLVTNTGYLPADATLDDLIAAIDDSLKGTPRYSVVDDAIVAEQARIDAVLQELDRAGLDPKEMTVADLMAFFEAKAPDGAGMRSPEVQKIAADIEGLAQRFDEARLTLDDLEAAIKAADEFAPEVAETAKALRVAIREAEGEVRKLTRDIGKRREFADLMPEEIRSAAEEVTDTIMGNSPARMMTPADIAAGPRGPLKERTLQIPTALIREFIERDPTMLLRRATQTMATDTALVKKFGSTDLVEQVRQINDDYNARIAAVTGEGPKAEKARQKLDDARKADIRDITAMRDRLRGNYALPSDPDGLIVRAGRVVRNLNYLRLLGGQTISSFSDPAKIVFTHGLTRTLKTAWTPFTGGLSTLKMAAKEVELAGAAVGLLRDDRLMALSDIMDAGGKANRFERGLSSATGAFGIMTLMTPWNGVLKRMAGIITQTRTLQAIERVVKGTATAKEITYLAAGGIDPVMAGRIWRQFDGGPRVGFSDAADIAAQTDTPAFKRWFGKSKVVDESGRPLVVYHGTDAVFDAFDPAKIGTNFAMDRVGFFFTTSRDSANRSRGSYPAGPKYSFTEAQKAAAAGGRVIDAFVRIERPLYPKDVPGWESVMGASPTNLFDLNREAVTAALASGDYDGFIAKSNGERLVVALSPTQIKSASGNSGAFDPDNPVIFSDARGADEDGEAPRENVDGYGFDLGEWRADSAKPLGEQAQSYVLRRGQTDAVEYLVALDNNGVAVGHFRGTASLAGMSQKVERLLRQHGNRIVIHHNHPSNRSFSRADIETVGLPGQAVIYAHGHGGAVYSAALTPEARGVLNEKFHRSTGLVPSTNARMDWMGRVFAATQERLIPSVQSYIDVASGDVVTEANLQLSVMTSRILHDAGIIEYRTNVVTSDGPRIWDDDVLAAYTEMARNEFFEGSAGARRHALPDGHPGDVGVLFDGNPRAAADGTPTGGTDTGGGADGGGEAGGFRFEDASGVEPRRGGVRDGEVWWANTQSWTDRQAIDAFRAMIVRDVDRTIISPGQEKPLWMSTETGKLIGQFKSFAVASVQRTLMSGLQQRDMAALNGTLLMLGLGAMAYYTKASIAGMEISDDPAKWATEALDYSGLLGWLMEANNISESLTGGRLGLSLITGERATRYASRNVMGAALGPSFDMAGDVFQSTRAISTGEWTESDIHALRKLLPFQNLFYIRQLLDAAEVGVSGGMRLN